VEKEEWRWCCGRPRKPAGSPDGNTPCRKVYLSNDADALFHQTWLDERLFGWSKSANRGTSAWAGATRSQEISRAATPDISEDEEVADYDNVLGYLPIYEGVPHGHHRVRSRQNSYADLQKLRMSAIGKGARSDFLFELCWAHLHAGDTHGSVETQPSALGEGEGLHLRHGHRARKASLSDGIAVDRIAAVDRQEVFKGVTEELNREIQEHRHEANA
jgi:glycerol-3-phosphate O-acyltransferase/dihydroxyacetone phosphate acyltransferase